MVHSGWARRALLLALVCSLILYLPHALGAPGRPAPRPAPRPQGPYGRYGPHPYEHRLRGGLDLFHSYARRGSLMLNLAEQKRFDSLHAAGHLVKDPVTGEIKNLFSDADVGTLEALSRDPQKTTFLLDVLSTRALPGRQARLFAQRLASREVGVYAASQLTDFIAVNRESAPDVLHNLVGFWHLSNRAMELNNGMTPKDADLTALTALLHAATVEAIDPNLDSRSQAIKLARAAERALVNAFLALLGRAKMPSAASLAEEISAGLQKRAEEIYEEMRGLGCIF